MDCRMRIAKVFIRGKEDTMWGSLKLTISFQEAHLFFGIYGMAIRCESLLSVVIKLF